MTCSYKVKRPRMRITEHVNMHACVRLETLAVSYGKHRFIMENFLHGVLAVFHCAPAEISLLTHAEARHTRPTRHHFKSPDIFGTSISRSATARATLLNVCCARQTGDMHFSPAERDAMFRTTPTKDYEHPRLMARDGRWIETARAGGGTKLGTSRVAWPAGKTTTGERRVSGAHTLRRWSRSEVIFRRNTAFTLDV